MSRIEMRHLEEPELHFEEGNCVHPKVGLSKYGARLAHKKKDNKFIQVGIIGSYQSVNQAQKVIHKLRFGSIPDEPTLTKYPYIGANKTSNLNFSIHTRKIWKRIIPYDKLEGICSRSSPREIVDGYYRLVQREIEALSQLGEQPDVVLVAAPEVVEDNASMPDREKGILQSSKGSVHSQLKLKAMEEGIPIQYVRNETLSFGRGVEPEPNVLWNLAVALLYKAGNGYPWKVANLDNKTCYAGVSFFRSGDDNLKSALAQVFLETGESYIVQGGNITTDGRNRPRLTKREAKRIGERVIDAYQLQRRSKPARLVIHKSSNFNQAEIEGFQEAIGEDSILDCVTVQDRNVDLKVFSPGQYPVLRGSYISAGSNQFEEQSADCFYVYSAGAVPYLNTYPNQGTPTPLKVKMFRRQSAPTKLLKELMKFTKLDWNNTDFFKKQPVTISISRKVSQILQHQYAENLDTIEHQYYYYM